MEAEDLIGIIILISYFFIFGIIGLLINTYINFNSVFKRKILHLIGVLSIIIFVYFFKTWWISEYICLILGSFSFITLWICEKSFPKINKAFLEKYPGEMKYTVFIIFNIYALEILLFWGILDKKYLIPISIISWGISDMFASLIGSFFGKHHFPFSFIESKKTIEGSISCFISSLICCVFFFIFATNYSWYLSILFAFIVSTGNLLSETLSHKGMDTIFMPLTSSLLLYLIFLLF